ncbi:MAG: copper amine oxidase N-terminal domain-containing protein [Caldiserica bacterium]|nr:copper amine oxidase N-terminal domain-containing protein [Caldisericota bacterium]
MKVLGCDGSLSLSIPSTSKIAIEANSNEPDDNSEITLTVAVSKEAKGTKTTVNIAAICDNGQQSSTQLSINVSDKTSTKITLWVGQKKAKVNDQDVELSVAPTVVNGKTLVPVRFISEAFGAKVEWDAKEQRIDLIFGLLADGSYTKKVTLWVGKKTAQSDFGSKLPAFREYTLDVAPTIISGTTMVPIRFISDVLGAKTTWDDKEKRIDITWSSM